MPLILAPYTLGAQLPAAPVATAGGGYYVYRRKQWWALAGIVFLCLFA